MKRSAFIKLGASTALTAGARVAFPWGAAAANRRPVSYAGSLWRAGGAGRIQTSTDAGRTWKLHSDLGSTNTIEHLAVHHNRLHLSVGYAGHSFPLVLARDKRSWLTA
jgi:hypothetical protein